MLCIKKVREEKGYRCIGLPRQRVLLIGIYGI